MTGVIAALVGGGGADGGVSLPASITVSDIEFDPTNADAILNFNNTGTYTSTGNTEAPSGTWKNTGAAADYDIMFDLTSGTTPGGDAVDVWLSLGTSRAWSVTDTTTTGGTVNAGGTLYIRRASSGVTIASCPVTLSANKLI